MSIKCTAQVDGRLPSTCGADAVCIVRTSHNAAGTLDTYYTEPLHAVPSWALWTGHALCEQHRYNVRVVTHRCTTTLHATNDS